jgi:hypothetical protein
VFHVELVTIVWENVREYNSCKKNHSRRRLEEKVIFQDRRIGKVERKDCGSEMGTRISTLVMVRVDIRLRSVGKFIDTCVQRRTRKM